MRKMSTGDDATLGNYLKMTEAVFGTGKAASFLKKKIAESPKGENEEVVVDEGQMIQMLGTLEFGGNKNAV